MQINNVLKSAVIMAAATATTTGCAISQGKLAGADTVIESQGRLEDAVMKYQRKIRYGAGRASRYAELLEEGEYIIPNKIFDIYTQTVDPLVKKHFNKPVGGYTLRPGLNKKSDVERFRQKLERNGLQKEEIEAYIAILTRPDTIILRESVFESGFIEYALPHERFHKEMKRVSRKDYQTLRAVAQQILAMRISEENIGQLNWIFSKKERAGIEERLNEQPKVMVYLEHQIGRALTSEERAEILSVPLVRAKEGSGFDEMAAGRNFEEFYAYLAEGRFCDYVETVLKEVFPDTYNIFCRIKDKTKNASDYETTRLAIRF